MAIVSHGPFLDASPPVSRSLSARSLCPRILSSLERQFPKHSANPWQSRAGQSPGSFAAGP